MVSTTIAMPTTTRGTRRRIISESYDGKDSKWYPMNPTKTRTTGPQARAALIWELRAIAELLDTRPPKTKAPDALFRRIKVVADLAADELEEMARV